MSKAEQREIANAQKTQRRQAEIQALTEAIRYNLLLEKQRKENERQIQLAFDEEARRQLKAQKKQQEFERRKAKEKASKIKKAKNRDQRLNKCKITVTDKGDNVAAIVLYCKKCRKVLVPSVHLGYGEYNDGIIRPNIINMAVNIARELASECNKSTCDIEVMTWRAASYAGVLMNFIGQEGNPIGTD